MSQCWDSLLELPKSSVVFATGRVISALMDEALMRESLMPCDLKRAEAARPSIRNEYLLYMKDTFGYDPYLAAKMKPILCDLPPTIPSDFSAVSTLFSVRDQMLHDHMMDDSLLTLLQKRSLSRIDGVELHPILSTGILREIETKDGLSSPISLSVSRDRETMLHAVMDRIGTLLDQNIPIDHIKLVNASAEDYATLARLSDLCGWQIRSHALKPVIQFPPALNFLKLFRENGYEDANKFLETLVSSEKSIDREIADAIINMINLYPSHALATNPDLFRYHLETDSISVNKEQNIVELIAFDQMEPTSDNYYLLLHYADGQFPHLLRDDDYLRDVEKASIGMKTSVEKNALILKETTRVLESTRHLDLFYAKYESGDEMRLSHLTPNRETVPTYPNSSMLDVSNSRDLSMLEYAKLRHKRLTYGTYDAYGERLSTVFEPNYRRFNPQFKTLSPRVTESLLGERVSLSATSLEQFFHCRFHYMLTYLLKFDRIETSIPLYLGNLAHDYLQKKLEKKDVFDLERTNRKIDPAFFNARTNDFTQRFLERLAVVADYLELRNQESQFHDVAFEQKFRYDLPDNPKFVVNGKIDRVMMYSDNEQDYVVVIDYKTGNAKFNHEDFLRGTDLQLVFYLHLLSHDREDRPFRVAGFYYQPVNIGKYARTTGDDPIRKILKLEGMSYQNETISRSFDPSGNVKGVRFKLDGTFVKSTRLFDDAMIQADLDHVKTLIREATSAILEGDFCINPLAPKRNQSISASCEYCNYQGLCYLAAKNDEEIESAEESLGEEE